ncbi:hypothetical protein EDB84DRAFT_1563047 [Lactarius hengduanensis]|nr:hypothetical protein EDB84DRAFT_1563047 [Lactarius hengduanensis]
MPAPRPTELCLPMRIMAGDGVIEEQDALVDTGSTDCHINQEYAEELGLARVALEKPRHLTNADNTSCSGGPLTHYTPLTIRANGIERTLPFYLSDLGSSMIILGIGYMQEFAPPIDWRTTTIPHAHWPDVRAAPKNEHVVHVTRKAKINERNTAVEPSTSVRAPFPNTPAKPITAIRRVETVRLTDDEQRGRCTRREGNVTVSPSPTRDSPRDYTPTADIPAVESANTPEDVWWDWQAEEEPRIQERVWAAIEALEHTARTGRLVSDRSPSPPQNRCQEPWE